MPQRHFQRPLRPARKSLRQIRTVISQNALSRASFVHGHEVRVPRVDFGLQAVYYNEEGSLRLPSQTCRNAEGGDIYVT